MQAAIDLLGEVDELRKNDTKLVEKAINLINQSIGGSSRTRKYVSLYANGQLHDHEQLLEIFNTIYSVQTQKESLMIKLLELQSSLNSDCFTQLNKSIDGMRRQLTLDQVVFARLREASANEDQDCLITILSCYKYSPYIRKNS